MHVRKREPRFIDYVSIYEFDEGDQDFIREVTSDDEYGMCDYSDGDYYYPVDLSRAIKDDTPDDVIEEFLSEDLPEYEYPCKSWRKSDYEEFITYLSWLKILRVIVNEVPEDVIERNKFAIYVSH